ncbi:MAG: serine hydrolase, partial [Pseudomonadales bacterium]|nr:serine hydrolase [Pseudomonadales bacterium]NIX08170.1 serine hydrolase [Pseudomonadales bacterium]
VPGGAVVLAAPNREETLTCGSVSVDQPAPVRTNTLFNVGSVAKTIVAAAIGSLAAERRLQLDDRLVDWVPEFKFPDQRLRSTITLRDCLAHRLGLAREGFWEWGASESLDLTTLLGRLHHAAMVRPYRSGYSYSNVGYAAAALAASRAAGLPFLDYVRCWLDLPADNWLTGGSAACGNAQLSACHVVGPPSRAVRPHFADNVLGASGIWASVEFARVWLRLQLGAMPDAGRRLPGRTKRELRLPHLPVPVTERPFGLGGEACTAVHYALGWFVTRYRGHRVLRHSGVEVGSSAHLAIAPDAGVGVFVMANAESPAADIIGLTLIDRLLGLSPRAWEGRAPGAHPAPIGSEPRLNVGTTPIDPNRLHGLTGTFRNPANGPVRITARQGRLQMAFRDAPRFDGELVPRAGGRFQPRPTDPGVRSLMEEHARFEVRADGVCEFRLPGFGTWRRS